MLRPKLPVLLPHRLATVLAPVASFSFRMLFAEASPLIFLEKRDTEPASACSEHVSNDTTSALFWGKIIVIIVLVIMSGIVAGLALGLMSLDETNLSILSNSGTPQQRKYAERIIPIRKNGHLLLVTLLLTNTLINESLPVLFDSIFGGGVIAIVASTVLLVIFAEILPQAVCSRYGLQVGAFFAWPVRILTWILFIVAYPIAKLLDWILGTSHGMIYRRAELKELIAIHGATKQAGGDLTTDAVTIVQGAIEMQDKRIRDAMTPINRVFMVNYRENLDRSCLNKIQKAGHSRIPVYEVLEKKKEGENGGQKDEMNGDDAVEEEKDIVGVLLVKSLVLLDPDDGIPLSHIKLYPIPSVSPHMPLFDILNTFQEGRSHMALVREDIPLDYSLSEEEIPPQPSSPVIPTDAELPEPPVRRNRALFWRRKPNPKRERDRSPSPTPSQSSSIPLPTPEPQLNPAGRVLGIITLEDVLEELIQEEIYDESDMRRLAGVAVRWEPRSGERFVVARHRLAPGKKGEAEEMGEGARAAAHRKRREAGATFRSARNSGETTRSLDEIGARQHVILDEKDVEQWEEAEESEDTKRVPVKRSMTDPGAGNADDVTKCEVEGEEV